MAHESLLRARIRKRRQAQKRQFLMILLFSLLLGIWLWYSFVYTHTPDFAIKEARNAVMQHDAEKFKTYVNVDLIVSNCYDDLTIDLFHYGSDQSQAVKRFYTLVRPQLVTATSDLFLRFVQENAWSMPQGSAIMKGNQLGIDYEWFIEYSQLRNTEITDITNIVRTGNVATADASIINNVTKTPFTLKLTIEQTDNGRWQIVSVNNYRAYLTSVLPIIQQNTIKYYEKTKPISISFNESFVSQRAQFKEIVKAAKGDFSSSQKDALTQLIKHKTIPMLKARQKKINAVPVPPGAQYLAKLRQQSTNTTIAAWEHFLNGILSDNLAELNQAETLHKQEMETDYRIENIIEFFTQ